MSFQSIASNGSETEWEEPIRVRGVKYGSCLGCGVVVFRKNFCSGSWFCKKDFDDWFMTVAEPKKQVDSRTTPKKDKEVKTMPEKPKKRKRKLEESSDESSDESVLLI